jgi:hypothetical protein
MRRIFGYWAVRQTLGPPHVSKAARPKSNLRNVRKPRANRRFWIGVAALVAVAIVAVAALRAREPHPVATHHDIATETLPGVPGPEGIPLEVGAPLASLRNAATGQPVDGIQCGAMEQTDYHIHTHLTVYVDGALRPIPAGIGIVRPVAQQTPNGAFYSATDCYYWLHVHAYDGVIHIESPTTRTYTLGQFFAIWGQPLSKNRIGPVAGTLSVFVDGRSYKPDPAGIKLGSREDIQISVGSPTVPPKRVDWSTSGL